MLALTSLALLAGVCGVAGTQQPRLRGEAWPEADRLFRQDPRWLGADAAFSVPLGDGRVLWLFGDTFVATSEAHRRAEARMVRNTIGVQTGTDPTTAGMSFFWRGSADSPASFFAEEGEHWYWPQHGIRLGRGLLLFLMRIHGTPGQGLGFAADGWRVALLDDARGSPEDWSVRLVEPGAGAAEGWIVGAALLEIGEHVVALAIREPGDHAGYLLRWSRADLVGAEGVPSFGQETPAECWTGAGWCSTRSLTSPPALVLDDAGPESSLHLDAALGCWVHVKSVGFGATTIGVSFAPRLEGPWSEHALVFRPPESDRPAAFVYAAKAHPELTGARLALTYASNTLGDFANLVNDDTLYYPRFVRLNVVD
jgi:hypothetical protein